MGRLAVAALTLATLMGVLAVASQPIQPAPEITTAAVTAHPIIATVPTTPTSTTIDTSGTPANTYRVPAAAVTNDGTLVVCYDARNNSSADLPSDIDIACKNSADEGATFSTRRVAVAHSGGNTDSTASGVGDAQLTYDPVAGVLDLFYLSAPTGVGVSNSSTDTSPSSTTTVHPRYRTSTDDGVTWSGYTDLTALAKTPGSVTGVFASSGRGAYNPATGGISIPYAYTKAGVTYGGVLFSFDHGANWNQQNTNVAGNEHKIVPLSNGTWLDDVRNNAGGPLYRRFSVFNNGWGPSTDQVSLPDPLCNGDLLRVDPVDGNPDSAWLLESNPDSQTTRVAGEIRLSLDNGVTWRSAWSPETSTTSQAFGYSSMVAFPDGSYGIAYEHSGADAGRSLVWVHFSLAVFP